MKSSADLPTYMQIQHSFTSLSANVLNKSQDKRHRILNSAVSIESPTNFHLKYIKILDCAGKNAEIATPGLKPERFLSNLKRNTLFHKDTFNYSDIKHQLFDYHSIGLGKGINLLNEHLPGFRSLTPYAKEYSNFLHEGFGRRRGQFTVEAAQAKVKRIEIKDLTLLRKSEIKSLNKKSVSVTTNKEIKLNKNRIRAASDKKLKGINVKKLKIERLKDLDDFEKRLAKMIIN